MKYISTLLLLLCAATTYGQGEKQWIYKRIDVLSAPDMYGRGYVNNGCGKAAQLIADQFRSFGVKPLNKNGSYFQDYTFPINTFPGEVSLTINGQTLRPGIDYLVHAASSPWHEWKSDVKTIRLTDMKDSLMWEEQKAAIVPGGVYYLQDADTPTKYFNLGIRKFAHEFPKGLYIVPKKGKLIWTANQDTTPATIFYVEDSVLNGDPESVVANVDTKFLPEFDAKNVIGYVPGTEQPDSFIVFSAHYDHLGCMGQGTIFYGAHDNASGTSLVLYLANYFAQHPQRYSVAFMLFSGEEVGLLGSKYYTEHPIAPLDNIRFLVNLDMTGYASKGITVVNGVSHEPEFAILDNINTKNNYLENIRKRERTSNSDHYHFSKNGVPAVFIYGNGGKPFYHDVFDIAKEITLDNVDDMAHLLIDFTNTLTNSKK